MIDTVVGLFKRRGEGQEAPPPDMPPGFQVHISGNDAEEPFEGHTVADCIGAAYGLAYTDAAGDESRRRITLKSIAEGNGYYYMNAHCHERQAHRQFRSDRVMELVHLDTGEFIEDVDDFLAGLLDQDKTGAAIDRLRPGVQVLIFMALCDGNLHNMERNVIVEYVCDAAGEGADRTRVRNYVRAVYPETETFFKALDKIAKWDIHQLHQLVSAIRELVDADGILDPEEVNWLIEIEAVLGRLN